MVGFWRFPQPKKRERENEREREKKEREREREIERKCNLKCNRVTGSVCLFGQQRCKIKVILDLT